MSNNINNTPICQSCCPNVKIDRIEEGMTGKEVADLLYNNFDKLNKSKANKCVERKVRHLLKGENQIFNRTAKNKFVQEVFYVWSKKDVKNELDEFKDVADKVHDHLIDYNNPHKVTKAQVGLGNVDNTSDKDKPISDATQTALDQEKKERVLADNELKAAIEKEVNDRTQADTQLQQNIDTLETNMTSNINAVRQSLNNHISDTENPHQVTKAQVGLGNVTNDAQVKRAEMGVASGVATLNESGLVPSSQLPSYVDDVLEYNTLSSFPPVGEDGKIYVTKDTNLTYRWSGSTYIEISQSLALGETSSTAFPGDRGKALEDKVSFITNTGDGTKYLADNGQYYEINTDNTYVIDYITFTQSSGTITAEQYNALKSAIENNKVILFGNDNDEEYYSQLASTSYADSDGTLGIILYERENVVYVIISSDYSYNLQVVTCLTYDKRGTVGQVLTKTENSYAWQDPRAIFPEGGTAGQVLKKTAYGVEWGDVETALSDDYTASTDDSPSPTAGDTYEQAISKLHKMINDLQTQVQTLQAQLADDNIWYGTESEYNSLQTKEQGTLYVIINS